MTYKTASGTAIPIVVVETKQDAVELFIDERGVFSLSLK